MKRDMDLIRQTIRNAGARDFENSEAPGPHRARTVEGAYQIAPMNDAGLVQADYTSEAGTPVSATIFRLTRTGHDFIDAAGDDTIWRKAREIILKPGISWTFPVLAQWLMQAAHKKLFGIPQRS